ncbi:MAG: hypothetical protein Q7S93_05885 [Phenylobacterium sp.]|uniref:hypothetical protein n=1 Tax=Phenylobacterium sp. TaxID=1871053 RepID=UPI00271CEC92|nr:hypothetical protein [Phenylobacterium sp.]MDO8409572.1 hypothetical protein [Phenylobacterium sp.]
MSRLLESRSFWFKLVCVLCLAFSIMVQVLQHFRDEPSSIARQQPVEAHAPGGRPVNPDQE